MDNVVSSLLVAWLMVIAVLFEYAAQNIALLNARKAKRMLGELTVIEYMGIDGEFDCVALKKGLRKLVDYEDTHSARHYMTIYVAHCVDKSSEHEPGLIDQSLDKLVDMGDLFMESKTEWLTHLNTDINRIREGNEQDIFGKTKEADLEAHSQVIRFEKPVKAKRRVYRKLIRKCIDDEIAKILALDQ